MKLLSGNIEPKLFSRSFVRIVTVCAVSGLAMSAVSLLPAFQNGIIRFAEETLVHRIIDHEKWLRRLFDAAFIFISIAALAVAFLVSINGSDESSKMKKAQIVFPAVLLLFVLFYTSYIIYRYGDYWLDFDSSAELVGAKMLAEENALFSSKWYYSTEFSFIYHQPFAILLFRICNNWPLIRAVNFFLQNLTLILGFLFMMRQIKVPFKYCLLISCFLIIPLTVEYWIQHFIGYYHHFYIKTFLMAGCFFALLQRREKRTAGILYAVLLYALAFLTGTEGIRILYSFLLPLVLTVILAAYFDVIKEKTAAYRTIFTALGLSFLGFLVNTIVLKKFFVFAGLEKAAIENFGSGFFEKFSHIFFDFYASFWGFKYARVLSIEGFLSAASLLFFTASIAGSVIYIKNICTIRKKQLFSDLCRNCSIECFLLLYFIITLLFHFVFFMFINGFDDTAARYFFPALIFLFAAIPVFLTLSLPGTNRLVHSCLWIVLCGLLFGHAALIFDKQLSPDENKNKNRNGYLAYLEANSLVYGFAPFWTGNVTTELSNGRVEMVGLAPSSEEAWKERKEVMYRYRWLNPVKFDNPYYHKGQAFLLLRKDEWDALKNRDVFTDKSPAYIDDFFVVLTYPEAAVIHREIMGENF